MTIIDRIRARFNADLQKLRDREDYQKVKAKREEVKAKRKEFWAKLKRRNE